MPAASLPGEESFPAPGPYPTDSDTSSLLGSAFTVGDSEPTPPNHTAGGRAEALLRKYLP